MDGKKLVLGSGERKSGEKDTYSKPCRPRRGRRVYLNSLLARATAGRGGE